MMRLALNLATTRIILTSGHEGAHAAGAVIQAFGQLLMGGNFVIGVIVFAILVIVNFVVITKGSGRIAEVSARFTLDAMPGKQMAIDADLSAGLIDEREARQRRQTLEDESSFFGSMDGAAKFVRGDAVAGLLIVFINVVAGIVIGAWFHNLTLAQAAQTYTLLTVGDGLVTQVPALIVSTAAGLLVSKAGVAGSADKALFSQLGGYPKALGLCSFLTFGMALLPGIPILPFLVLSLVSGGAAYAITATRSRIEEQQAAAAAMPPAPVEEPISTALHIDNLRLELGYGLLPLINSEKGQRLTDQIKALRRQLASEMGFVMPAVRIQDNMQLPSFGYVIRVKEIAAGRGEVRPNHLLVMDPRGDAISLPGEQTREPTFGLPAMWVDEANREEALFKGYTVVDPPTVMTTHLTEIIKVLQRNPEAARRARQGAPEADRGHRADADLGGRHPARAAEPAVGAGIDPRSAGHPRGYLRGVRPHAQCHGADGACPCAACAPAVRFRHRRRRLYPARDDVAGMGAGLRGVAGRPGRGAAAVDGAQQAAGIHRQGAAGLRTARDDGRDPDPAHQPARAPLCPVDRRALPPGDGRHVTERGLLQSTHQDNWPGVERGAPCAV
jgi:flagellar biosynthesis protein FlhA